MERKKWNDIVSKFDLPERQAKVKQLLKINENEGEVWCICRSSDCSTFMIGCDKCDEWYHGSCIGLKERESKKIKKYYCQRCRDEDPDLEIQYKPQYAEQMLRKKLKRARAEHDSTGEAVHSKKQKTQETHQLTEDSIRPSKSTPRQSSVQRPKPEPSPVIEELKQCFGPGCCEAARVGSKYCSDDCGMNLARNRIFEMLPWRVSQWVASPSVADVRNQKDLESVREERNKLHSLLALLDSKKSKLEDLIRRTKATPSYSNERTERDSICTEGIEGLEESAAEGSSCKSSEEAQLDCVSCGNPQPPKTAFRHMERCFSRLEGQTTCWSVMSTRIDGDSMLCDYYSQQLNMYCKRLKHICPEHYKEEKSDSEVCGCPLVVPGSSPIYEVCYGGSTDEDCGRPDYTEFCRQLKSRCHRHISWERLRRAHIDLERFKLWSRLEELMERENVIRYALSQRAGVVALMLNETIDCDPDVPLISEKKSVSESTQGTAPPPPDEHQYCSFSKAPDSKLEKMDTTA